MIPLPDFTVRRVIEQAVTDLLADDQMLATEMLGELAPDERDSFLTALKDRGGKVRLGWGEEFPPDWCVTVAKAGGQPVHTLGGVVSADEPSPLAMRELAGGITAEAEVPLVFTAGVPEVGEDIPARGMVRLGPDGGEYAIYRVEGGVCILEKRGILRSTPAAHGEDTPVMFFEHSQRRGWAQRVQMRLDVLAAGGDFTSILAAVLEAYLIQTAAAFDARGYTLQDVSSTDLAPRPAMFPVHFAVRTITVTLQTTVSLPERHGAITATPFTPTIEHAEGQVHHAA